MKHIKLYLKETIIMSKENGKEFRVEGNVKDGFKLKKVEQEEVIVEDNKATAFLKKHWKKIAIGGALTVAGIYIAKKLSDDVDEEVLEDDVLDAEFEVVE